MKFARERFWWNWDGVVRRVWRGEVGGAGGEGVSREVGLELEGKLGGSKEVELKFRRGNGTEHGMRGMEI